MRPFVAISLMSPFWGEENRRAVVCLVEEIRDKTNTERKQLKAIEGEKLLAPAKDTHNTARELFTSGARPQAAPAGPSAGD
jgi:hypothetical protein